jgi:hypothetical protein
MKLFTAALIKCSLLIFFVPSILFSQTGGSEQLPVIPIGLDAYRMWDKLPYHKIGIRAYMRSTYDREGGNRWRMQATFSTRSPTPLMLHWMLKGRGFCTSKERTIFTEVPGIMRLTGIIP